MQGLPAIIFGLKSEPGNQNQKDIVMWLLAQRPQGAHSIALVIMRDLSDEIGRNVQRRIVIETQSSSVNGLDRFSVERPYLVDMLGESGDNAHGAAPA
jgi:hypothetical protein